MGKYEYKVLPAPRRAKRARGVKGEPARFAHAITELMNVEAAEGWEYVKSETLPMEAKTGVFKGRAETFQTLLVFRRTLESDEGEIVSVTPAVSAPMTPIAPVPTQTTAPTAAAAQPEAEELPEMRPEKVETNYKYDEPLQADRDPVNFSDQKLDPLKNLVDDHRIKGSE